MIKPKSVKNRVAIHTLDPSMLVFKHLKTNGQPSIAEMGTQIDPSHNNHAPKNGKIAVNQIIFFGKWLEKRTGPSAINSEKNATIGRQ